MIYLILQEIACHAIQQICYFAIENNKSAITLTIFCIFRVTHIDIIPIFADS